MPRAARSVLRRNIGMRFNRFSLSVLMIFSAIALCIPAQAQTWEKKAYDATYEMQSPAGTMIQRRITDGKGRIRMEMTMPQGQKMTTIYDMPNQVSYMVIDQSRMVMKNKLDSKTGPKGPKMTSAEKAKEMGATPLGAKVIDGHPCHGFRHTSEGGTTEAWIGDDIGTLVFLTSNAPRAGKMTMKLKDYKASTPSDGLFQPPSGYQVMNMPGAMGGAMGGGMPSGGSPFGGRKMPSGLPGGLPFGR